MAQLPPSDKFDEDELRQRVGDLAYDVLRNQGTSVHLRANSILHILKRATITALLVAIICSPVTKNLMPVVAGHRL